MIGGCQKPRPPDTVHSLRLYGYRVEPPKSRLAPRFLEKLYDEGAATWRNADRPMICFLAVANEPRQFLREHTEMGERLKGCADFLPLCIGFDSRLPYELPCGADCKGLDFLGKRTETGAVW